MRPRTCTARVLHTLTALPRDAIDLPGHVTEDDMRPLPTETSSRRHSTFHRLAVVSRRLAPTPCDILPYDKRLNASEFPRLLSAKRGRVTYTSRSQAGSPPRPSLFASPIRLFHRCPVTRTVYTMAMNIHGIEPTTLHFAKDPRSKQADLRVSMMSWCRPSRLQC
jgi:hypothetical protein